MTDLPTLPPEQNRQGCLGSVLLILAMLMVGFGLMTLIFSGLCTALFIFQPDFASIALLIGLPTMIVGFGLWRLGLWLFRRTRGPRNAPPPSEPSV